MRNLVIAAVVGLILGIAACRGGQKVVVANFGECMDAGIRNVQTIEELYDLQESCMPNKLVRTILFW